MMLLVQPPFYCHDLRHCFGFDGANGLATRPLRERQDHHGKYAHDRNGGAIILVTGG